MRFRKVTKCALALCGIALAVALWVGRFPLDLWNFSQNFKDFARIFAQDSSNQMRILSPQAQNLKYHLQSTAQVGDLIFRKGKNSESALIAGISNSPFSHIGIVASVEPLRIIHATTDDDPSAPNRVILSGIDDFLLQAHSIGLKRLPLPQNTRDSIASHAIISLGAPFVLNTSDEALYCTTLVRDSIIANTPTHFAQEFAANLHYTQVNFAMLGGKYLFPSAFWEYDGLETIVEATSVD